MIKFLIKRPIGVTVIFIAFVLMSLVSSNFIPISLMPEVDIPEIIVKLDVNDKSASEIEEQYVRKVRRQLLQLTHLEDIESSATNGQAFISLKFNFGTEINYAFIEVNEKIDALMPNMPQGFTRPKVIKTSATDIPVFYLNVKLKEQDNSRFMQLSEFCNQVIKKRVEQIPEVAMVDISGLEFPELVINVDLNKLSHLNIDRNTFINALKANDLSIGNIKLRNGLYEFNVRYASMLKDRRDIENLMINIDGKIFKLKQLAKIEVRSNLATGHFVSNGDKAIVMAVIKKGDAKIADLRAKVNELMDSMYDDYPQLEISIERNQTELLDYSISNLKSGLFLGAFLAFIIMFLFLKDVKSPFLIGLSVPISLVLSILFFFIFDISINIISLSGLILGVGMMIDNSIIVIDNISQHRDSGLNVFDSCVKGTNEVIRPLISSVLTTCAVFIPLVFISGISGALFYDQAMAVTIGLFVSLIVSFTIIPVYFKLLKNRESKFALSLNSFVEKISFYSHIEGSYEKVFSVIFKNKTVFFVSVTLITILGLFIFNIIPKERFPKFTQTEIVYEIDWNRNINSTENKKRINSLLKGLEDVVLESSCLIGEQTFLLDKSNKMSSSQAKLYLKVKNESDLSKIDDLITKNLNDKFPNTLIKNHAPETVFEKVFDSDSYPLVLRIMSKGQQAPPDLEEVESLITHILEITGINPVNKLSSQKYYEIAPNFEKLLLYGVNVDELVSTLKKALNRYQIFTLKSGQYRVPVYLSGKQESLNDLLRSTKVKSEKKASITLNSLVTVSQKGGYSIYKGGKSKSYVEVAYNVNESQANTIQREYNSLLNNNKQISIEFVGAILENNTLMKELAMILSVSIALLFFILSAQFESLTQPLIVLLEIPIDIAGALLVLYLSGNSLNLMSMIGIIVMTGIIINDSILKIDTINQLRKSGISTLEAIHTAGKRRLKPIVMTSLTTILAMIPFIFSNDMGSRLQQPLAWSIIGGMTIGTLVSLYFIPLAYYFLVRKHKKKDCKKFTSEESIVSEINDL